MKESVGMIEGCASGIERKNMWEFIDMDGAGEAVK
jgi:hypothetical protein